MLIDIVRKNIATLSTIIAMLRDITYLRHA